MSYRLVFSLIWCFGLILLASCSSSDEPVLDLPPLTLAVPPTAVYSGECTDTSTLEAWLQTILFQQRDFVTLMEEAESQSAEALYLSVEELALLHIRVSEEPAPGCGQALHGAILAIMNDVVLDLQSYVNGDDSSSVNRIVENARVAFNGLLPQQAELMNLLESQFGN